MAFLKILIYAKYKLHMIDLKDEMEVRGGLFMTDESFQ